jgi:hypothetical protein
VSVVVYDAGALIAADRDDVRFMALHRGWIRGGVVPVLAPSVLAQVWRSPRQVQLARVVTGCRPHTLDLDGAREVGRLLAASRTTDVVDASVVIACRGLAPVAVVTSARGDLTRLADAIGLRLPVVDV